MRAPLRICSALALLAVACNGSAPQNPNPATVGYFSEAAPRLQYPIRIATAGTMVWVSDARANAVIGFSETGPTIALEGLDQPIGLAISDDLLYVGNAGRNNVEVYSVSGRRYLRTLGSFELPNSIAVAPDGTVLVADSKRDLIAAFSQSGTPLPSLGSRGNAPGELMFPVAVAVDATRIAVGDQLNHRVQIFDRSGAFQQAIGSEIELGQKRDDYRGRFTSIGSVALHGSDLYVLESVHAYVQVFDQNGVHKGLLGQAGDCPTCTTMPLDIAVDERGRVLATDPEKRRWVALSSELR